MEALKSFVAWMKIFYLWIILALTTYMVAGLRCYHEYNLQPGVYPKKFKDCGKNASACHKIVYSDESTAYHCAYNVRYPDACNETQFIAPDKEEKYYKTYEEDVRDAIKTSKQECYCLVDRCNGREQQVHNTWRTTLAGSILLPVLLWLK